MVYELLDPATYLIEPDKVYQLLAYGRGFSLGTPASSTTKTGRHNIAESGVKHQKSIRKSRSCITVV
jgi:hypothetical protein